MYKRQKYFVSLGADVRAKDDRGSTPLHWEGARNLELAKYYVSLGADVNAKDNKGQTPLHNAAYLNYDAEVVKYLVSVGADVHAKDEEGSTPLDMAKQRGSQAVVKVLSGLK